MFTKIQTLLSSFQSSCHPKRDPPKVIVPIGSGDRPGAAGTWTNDLTVSIVEKITIIKQGNLSIWGGQI